ncbi:MAG: carboxypeptidase-like regulatory domain-containing protein [Bacteroidaceae bacterium]|nr:carboxypeptidase-like regulatory domain-containing protein [Bacteroidaceae bacterium]
MRRATLLLIFVLTLCSEAWGQKNKRDVYEERELQEVLVKPKRQRYRRKGNPAVELMRKVIDAKGDHNLEKNDFVRYNKYQRITTSLDNITQKMIDSMKVLQKPIIRRQIEYCPQTEKYILPFNYTETVTQHLWRRNPELERNYILGTNSEGITDLIPIGDNVNTIIASIFTDVNIYDDVVTLFERKFTSPLSSRAAISFFQFFIEDTLVVDGKNTIQLNFVPQNPQDFGFSGRIWILNDSTYRVHKCILNLPLRSSVNWVNTMVIEQKFTDLPNGQRVLQTDDLFAELGILKKHRQLVLHRATNYTQISVDSIPDIMFLPSDKPREGSPNVGDSLFWARHRVDTLSWGESGLKDMSSRMNEVVGGTFWMYLMRSVIVNSFETSSKNDRSPFDFGPIMSMVSHNFIDGWRFRVGGQSSARVFPKLFFKGYVAYGVDSRKWYGLAELEYSFLRKRFSPHEFPRNSITASWQYDVFSPADLMWQNGRDKDNAWTAMKWTPVEHMMFQRHWLLRYEVETNNHLGIKLQWKNARITPCGALFYQRLDSPSPAYQLSDDAVPHINTSDLTLSLRWAPGEEIINSKHRRRNVNHNNPVFALSHTIGMKGVFGSDYRYNTTELTVFERIWLNSYGRIDLNFRGAIAWNKAPFPLLLMPVANNSYLLTRDMFNMIQNLEFVNDRYVSLQAEWDLSGKLLNRIPLLKSLKLREVIGFKVLYGHLTDKNNPDLNPGDHDLFYMPSRGGESIVHPMSHTPYMEFSVGLHNILKCLRIDYVRRLNYLDYPGVKKHGVRAVLQFDF